ncbi:MAG: 6-carboxytetrahydropterin synthase [Ignavibacteria bacterium]|nr:6-carboxytetrahydropterin synthase [Ignavibacteria bacterium]
MKISKEFRWEMGHRLPLHQGPCRNVHGHSYRMFVELEGEPMETGMIIDFSDLSLLIKPIIEELDHSFLCSEDDKELIEFLKRMNLKYTVVKYFATVENICKDLFERIKKKILESNLSNIKNLTVRIHETPNAYAEYSGVLKP